MMRWVDTLRVSISEARLALLNGGFIYLYADTQPAKGATVTNQTLIATLELNNPAGTTDNGELTLSFVSTNVLCEGSGNVSWARGVSSTDSFVFDSDVGGLASTAPIRLDNVIAFLGGRINVVTAVLTEL